MKKVIYALIVSLVMVSALVLANREINNETIKKPTPKILSIAEKKDEMKKWEASLEGIKVRADEAKIRKHIKDYTNMEGVVTSLSLPLGSRLGFGVMVKINGDDYILSFGSEKSDKNFLNFNNEFQQLHSLKVNDKIIIKSHNVSHAPKYSYPIVSGDYVEKDSKILYKRASRKGGC